MQYRDLLLALIALLGIGLVGCDLNDTGLEGQPDAELERVEPEADVEVMPSGEADVDIQPEPTTTE